MSGFIPPDALLAGLAPGKQSEIYLNRLHIAKRLQDYRTSMARLSRKGRLMTSASSNVLGWIK